MCRARAAKRIFQRVLYRVVMIVQRLVQSWTQPVQQHEQDQHPGGTQHLHHGKDATRDRTCVHACSPSLHAARSPARVFSPIVLSFLALALGPLLVLLARRAAWSTIAVDSFCVITICGFALLHLLPECIEQAGWLVIPLALAGFLAPTLAERGLRWQGKGLRRIVLFLALLGMAAHDTLDGIFLHAGSEHAGHVHAHGHAHDGEVTAWAIILHRIPEGIGIWWIVPRTLGTVAAVLVTVVTVAATLFGYFLGHDLENASSTGGLAMLQALLAGSLLHVVLHAHIPAPRDKTRWHFASVAGAAIAIAVLYVVIHDHFPEGEHGSVGGTFVRMAAESAPALLLAYAIVGLCHAFLPAGWLQRMTRGNAFVQALRGVAIGLPLPVCSCGVVPIYRQLVAQGASMSAAIAFLVATPELEITAVLLTWSLLGGKVALVRVVMAAVLALLVGMVVSALAGKQRAAPSAADGAALPEPQQGSLATRLKEALRFGYGPAVDNTATWIVMGLLLSAMLVPYVDKEWIASLPAGIDVPIAALIGLPLYVCATGSTPLAAILLAKGLSPGAVLALLLTGPATNLTTFGVLGRLHGKRTAALFAAAMWVGTIALGYLANLLLAGEAFAGASPAHEHGDGATVWLVLLAALFAWSLLRQGVRPFLERLFESPANHDHTGHGHDHSCCAHEPGDAAHHHGKDHAALRPALQGSHGLLPPPDAAAAAPKQPTGTGGGHDCRSHGH